MWEANVCPLVDPLWSVLLWRIVVLCLSMYPFELKTREEDPSLMNAFRKRKLKLLVDRIKMGFLFRTRRKQIKGSVRQIISY